MQAAARSRTGFRVDVYFLTYEQARRVTAQSNSVSLCGCAKCIPTAMPAFGHRAAHGRRAVFSRFQSNANCTLHEKEVHEKEV